MPIQENEFHKRKNAYIAVHEKTTIKQVFFLLDTLHAGWEPWWHLLIYRHNTYWEFCKISDLILAVDKNLKKIDKQLSKLDCFNKARVVDRNSVGTREAKDLALNSPKSIVVVTEGDKLVGIINMGTRRGKEEGNFDNIDFTKINIEKYNFQELKNLLISIKPLIDQTLSGPDELDDLVSRSLQVQFPEIVSLGQTNSLLIWLNQEMNFSDGLPVSVNLGSELNILVQPQLGFRIDGPSEGKLTVTNEEETLPIQFKLVATKLGIGQIRILCFKNGQPLGSMIIKPVIEDLKTIDISKEVSYKEKLASISVTQPDLSIIILENPNRLEITFRLYASDPELGLNLNQFGPIKIKKDPIAYFNDFFSDIEGLPNETSDDKRFANLRLSNKGLRLYQDLLPDNLGNLIWSLRNRIKTVQILSDEPWIPWELLKLQGKENNRVVEGQFFCEAFSVSRWFLEIKRRPYLQLRNLALVVPKYSELAYSVREKEFILSLDDDHRQVSEVQPSYFSVIDNLSSGNFDGWHFIGHGNFSFQDPDQSEIFLEDRNLRPEDISGQVKNFGLNAPIVFFNACQTMRGSIALTGSGGWAKRIIESGAGAFIGPLWSVYDEAAYLFSKEFYTKLISGLPIGLAIKDARAVIRSMNDPSWLAYTVYAEPTAILREINNSQY